MTSFLRRLTLWDLSIADDRRDARPLDLTGWKQAPARRDPRTRFALNEARRLARLGDRTAMTGELQAMWAVYMVFVFIALILGMVLARSANISAWLTFAVAIGAFYLGLVLLRRRAAKVHRDRIVEIVAGAGLCPACAYDLSSTPPDDHDPPMVTCPECGGAWRASRLHERTPVRAQAGPSTGAFDTHSRGMPGAGRKAIRDDADRETALQVRTPRQALRDIPGADRERWTRAHILVRRLGAGRRLLAGGIILLGGLMMVGDWLFSFAPIPSFSGTLDQVLRLAMPAVMVWFGVAILRGTMAMDRREAKRILLNSRLCPTCSDDLDKGKVLSDGLVRCRTCAGVWRPLAKTSDNTHEPPDAPSALPRLEHGTPNQPDA